MPKASLRYACDQMCFLCIFDPKDKGSWRYQVECCTMPECSLYDVRPLPGRRHAGGGSLRRRIDLQCNECIYDPYDNGTWRQQVERCASGHCALYEVRPLPITKRETESVFVSPPERRITELNRSESDTGTPVAKTIDRLSILRYSGKTWSKPRISRRVSAPHTVTGRIASEEVKNNR